MSQCILKIAKSNVPVTFTNLVFGCFLVSLGSLMTVSFEVGLSFGSFLGSSTISCEMLKTRHMKNINWPHKNDKELQLIIREGFVW